MENIQLTLGGGRNGQSVSTPLWPKRTAGEGREKQPAEPAPPPPGPAAALSTSVHADAILTRTYLRYNVDDSGRVRVKVMNAANDEVLREIPPEEVAHVAEALRAYQQQVLERRTV